MARRLEEEFFNVGARHCGEQVPPLEEDANMVQASANPPPLTDENIRETLIQLVQAATVHAQAMMAQTNREILPRPPQKFATMLPV